MELDFLVIELVNEDIFLFFKQEGFFTGCFVVLKILNNDKNLKIESVFIIFDQQGYLENKLKIEYREIANMAYTDFIKGFNEKSGRSLDEKSGEYELVSIGGIEIRCAYIDDKFKLSRKKITNALTKLDLGNYETPI